MNRLTGCQLKIQAINTIQKRIGPEMCQKILPFPDAVFIEREIQGASQSGHAPKVYFAI